MKLYRSPLSIQNVLPIHLQICYKGDYIALYVITAWDKAWIGEETK